MDNLDQNTFSLCSVNGVLDGDDARWSGNVDSAEEFAISVFYKISSKYLVTEGEARSKNFE